MSRKGYVKLSKEEAQDLADMTEVEDMKYKSDCEKYKKRRNPS